MQGKCTKCGKMLFDVPNTNALDQKQLACLKCGRKHVLKNVDGIIFYKATYAKQWVQAE